jgi:hypothetical protein
MLDAEQAYKCAIPHCSGGHAVRRIGALAVQLLHAFARSVTAAAVLLSAFAYQRTKTFSVWIRLFFAAVFNPIVPLHLTRGAWSILNIAAGALFVGQFVVDRHRGKQKDGI